MKLLSRLFGKRRAHERLVVRIRVTIGSHEEEYWTEDVAEGGIRMNIGTQLTLAELTGGSRDVPLRLHLPDGDPAQVYGEPIWTVRTDENQLSTGWKFSRYEGDAQERLRAFVAGGGV